MSRTKWIAILAAALLAAACTQSPKSESTEVEAEAQKRAGGVEKAEKAEKAEKKRRLFVSNYQADTLSVVEGDPEIEVGTIPIVNSPHGLAVRPTDPPLLAVAHSTGFGVSFIDPDTLELKGTVETSRGPQDLDFSRDGKRLYVVSPLDWDLHVIDVDAMKVEGEPIKLDKKPRRVLVDDGGERVYVLLVASGAGHGAEVAVLDPKTREIVKRVPVDRHPQALAIGNNGRTMATASFDDSTITVIDTKTLEVTATYDALTGMGLAIHPTKPIAYSMESFDDVIQILDLQTGKPIKELTAGSWPTYPAWGPDGRYLYIPHEESDSVVKLDTETNEVAMKIAVGSEPIEVAVYEP